MRLRSASSFAANADPKMIGEGVARVVVVVTFAAAVTARLGSDVTADLSMPHCNITGTLQKPERRLCSGTTEAKISITRADLPGSLQHAKYSNYDFIQLDEDALKNLDTPLNITFQDVKSLVVGSSSVANGKQPKVNMTFQRIDGLHLHASAFPGHWSPD